MLFVFGNAIRLDEMFCKGKVRKVKVLKLLKKLRNFTFALGKWLGVLAMVRKRYFMKDLYKRTLRKVKIWGNERNKAKIVIVHLIELTQTKNFMKVLTAKLKYKLLLIQRWVRKCLKSRKDIYTTIFNYWKTFEVNNSLKKPKKKGKSFRIPTGAIPDRDKINHIRTYVKHKIKAYLFSIQTSFNSKPTLNFSFQEIEKQLSAATSSKRLSLRKSLYKSLK